MDLLKQHRGLILFEGIVFTLLGMLAIAIPGIATLSTEMFIGWLLLIGGVVAAYRSFQTREAPGFIGSFLVSLMYSIFGLLLLIYPLAGVMSLTLFLTFFFIVEGISKIILGFQLKNQNQWGWLIVSGIISLAMAAIIYAGWPSTAFWVIGLLVGINMLFFGISLIFLSFSVPKGDTTIPPANNTKV